MSIADRIRATREKRDISQSALARSVGVKPQSVQQWETGETEPRPNRVKTIANALNVSYVWLQTGEGSSDVGRARAIQEDRMGYGSIDDAVSCIENSALRRSISELVDAVNKTNAPPEKVEAAIKLVLLLLNK